MKPTPTKPGDIYGQLTVIDRGEDYHTPGGQRQPRWDCRCACGKIVSIIAGNLRAGRHVSCGCSKRNRVNLIGQTFGRLTVIERADGYTSPKGSTASLWVCECICGATVTIRMDALRSGVTRSCGCLARELATTHGGSTHPLYHVWESMNERCRTTTASNYANYGGRGIAICERWSGPDGFPNFIADMGERPPNPAGWKSRMPYWTLDRIDPDGNYEPENCRWADPSTQSQNQRRWK